MINSTVLNSLRYAMKDQIKYRYLKFAKIHSIKVC